MLAWPKDIDNISDCGGERVYSFIDRGSSVFVAIYIAYLCERSFPSVTALETK